ncbi:hypothetical protein A2867_03705 [Candidatus Daviesbacteria bacterium RIFCSPHIGHO2_01_FULL_40_11]|uniref:SprT-like domain-containing protein n=1 Tax=Candidatus Daviesbacteria bacterium RIFCSPHIGHO2_01_FULL_40_11 TaxID=1797762 RepID=A0A1F5JG02_9BACT|nr:MAG: hypothetical protein A2867_03705 [Candidatus Daviesbacteria bacterium RIFCSPHIGHO2_01_FULL_40_11]
MTRYSRCIIKRDNNWLLSRLDFIWTKYFSDIPQTNKVFISFGRFAKYRLGSIRLNKKTKDSFITITSMFKDPKIPPEVVDHTIGHELVHYTHGFSSIHPRLHKYPHAGGVVRKEMTERGMDYLYRAYKDWMKQYRRTLSVTFYG